MSCSHRPVVPLVRPGSARVLVTELSGSGHNPTPTPRPREEFETAPGLCLSPEKLESLCGTWDLSGVTSLEVSIDTQESSLGNIGAFLPNLVQLKLNNSVIASVRDLGFSPSHLQVLWMSRCCLRDLDGIFNFTSLKELYLAYNHVSDLNHVGMLENLQLLDVEGNDVDDLVQVQYLALCGKLQSLTLEGNPVCVRPTPTAPQTTDYRYRAAVRELLPQLLYLDNVRVEEEDGPSCSSVKEEEWDILRDVMRDNTSCQSPPEDEETVESLCTYSRPSSARRSASSLSHVSLFASRPHTGSRPSSATGSGVLSPHGSRPGSADSDITAAEAESSTLTHGAGKILFCGNPVQAIRAKREKLRTAPTKSTFTPRVLPIHVPEHTYDREEPDVDVRRDVIADLRAWREQHSRRLQAIETERSPQVLAIRHSEEEDEEDEGGDIDSFSDSSDEEEKPVDRLDKTPDSSYMSLSPDSGHRDALSSDVAQLSLSSDTTLSPLPPVSAAAAPAPPSGVQKPVGIRARRLQLSLATSEHLPDSSKVGRSHEIEATAGDSHLETLPEVRGVTRKNVPLLPAVTHTPHLPSSSEGSTDSCMDMESSCTRSGRKQHQTPQVSRPTVRPLRPIISRPHTARAVLQKHQQQRLEKQACRETKTDPRTGSF